MAQVTVPIVQYGVTAGAAALVFLLLGILFGAKCCRTKKRVVVTDLESRRTDYALMTTSR